MTPLVLLHGVGLDRHMWESFGTALGVAHHAYDMLGLGVGPRPPAPYTLAMYGQQLAEEVERLVGAEGAVDLLGFSMGALVAQRFALDHPRRVRRMVLVSGVFDRTAGERAAIVERVAEVRAGGYLGSVDAALERWFTPGFAATRPNVVETVRRRMLANDEASYADAYEVFATGDAELVARVGEIHSPCLVITGEEDQRSTPEMTYRLAAALPRGRAIVMPGVRHLVPLERPQELAAMVGAFLSEPDQEPDDA